MIKQLESPYIFEDNDASASAFGWDFQVNAGIYLFLIYIEEAKSVTVESKLQDIEIELKDKRLYAQAKALHDERTEKTENTKFRDAIVSLAKIYISNNDNLIYISNLKAPVDGDSDKFRNTIVSFNQCSVPQQKFIKKQVATIIANFEKKLKDSTQSKAQQKKLKKLIERLNTFCYDNLMIASIYPFMQAMDNSKNDQYKIIREKTIDVLSNIMGINFDHAAGLSRKLLLHWQTMLQYNSTISDNKNYKKSIDKKDFVWSVIALIGENVYSNFVEETLTKSIDDSIIEEGRLYLEEEENIYHERFEFMNNILQEYERFKPTVPKSVKSDKAFIIDKWQNFSSEFDDIHENDVLKEYITKCYMYKIINKNTQFNNISKGVKLCTSTK